MLNPEIDQYLAQGCGRCPLGGTPQCKVHKWPKELNQLRRLVLESGLVEERKWGVPVYTFMGSNVLIVSALNDYTALSFFKGVLLKDERNLLDKPGENTQSARLIKFTNVEDILNLENVLKAYVQEAIEIEKSGLKVTFNKNPEPLAEELENMLQEDPNFCSAFYALTPGRQRGYNLFFSAPKQSKTRISRIEKSIPNILNGKGLHD